MQLRILIVLFFLCQSAISQSYFEEIEKDFLDFMKSQEDKDFEKTLTYLTPEFLAFASREEILDQFEKTLNDSVMSFRYENSKIISIKEGVTIKERTYHLIKYSFDMVFMPNFQKDETPYKQIETILLMEKSISDLYGEENISTDLLLKTLTVHFEDEAYAIKIKGSSNWKMLNLKKGYQQFYSQFLPPELIPD